MAECSRGYEAWEFRTCPECGARNQLCRRKVPWRNQDEIHCANCHRGVVYHANESYEYEAHLAAPEDQ